MAIRRIIDHIITTVHPVYFAVGFPMALLASVFVLIALTASPSVKPCLVNCHRSPQITQNIPSQQSLGIVPLPAVKNPLGFHLFVVMHDGDKNYAVGSCPTLSTDVKNCDMYEFYEMGDYKSALDNYNLLIELSNKRSQSTTK